ncbi:hypothetical protein DL770_007625 [Monosporascus sp. CRB-9-2]|nr:hypothetical protein DL770_007625 [Monosporascus sp. CRB-9-2]
MANITVQKRLEAAWPFLKANYRTQNRNTDLNFLVKNCLRAQLHQNANMHSIICVQHFATEFMMKLATTMEIGANAGYGTYQSFQASITHAKPDDTIAAYKANPASRPQAADNNEFFRSAESEGSSEATPSKDGSDINRQTPLKAGVMAPSERRVEKSNQKPQRPETAKLNKSLEQELTNPPKFRVRLPASVPFELYVLPYRLSIANNFNFWLEKVKTDQEVEIEVSDMMQTGQARDLSEFIETSFGDYSLKMHAKFHHEKEREELFERQEPMPPSSLPAGQAARQEDMPFHSEVEAHKKYLKAAKP